MDNSIHSTWKSERAAFPRPANRVTHNSMIQPVIHISTNADDYVISPNTSIFIINFTKCKKYVILMFE